MDDWKDVLSKRQRRRGRKKKDPVDIFAGERLAEEDRADSRMKREAEELEERKQKVKDSKRIKTTTITPKKGGGKRYSIYGEDAPYSISRTDSLTGTCARCGNRLRYVKYKYKDLDPKSETGRMRYCKRCAEELGEEKFDKIVGAGPTAKKPSLRRVIVRNRKKARK